MKARATDAVGCCGDVGQSRHNVAAAIDGENLHFVSRSVGPEAANAHNANLVTFHTVKRFRDAVY